MCLVTSLAASSEANTGDIRAECQSKWTYYCGNIYISVCALCVCGDNTFSYGGNDLVIGKKCCPAPGEECHTNDEGDGVCNNGIMINRRSQSCHYAHFSCDNRTVNQYEMCHGYGLCQDGTDLEQCSALGCDNDHDYYYIYYNDYYASCGTNTNTGHRECDHTSEGNDGSYDCLNRRDEKIVSRDTSVRIDFSELKKCDYNKGRVDGLTCGSDCIPNTEWCREEKSRSCETENSSFNTASKEICSNATIWRENNITCNVDISDEIWRCGGNNQQCVYPLYTTPYPIPISIFPRRCEDRSDQVFRAGLTCWGIALDYVKTWCDTFCTPEKIERIENLKENCPEKCDDPSAWLSEQTDPYFLDPHLCQHSCQNQTLHCEACSNEKYPRCRKNNVPVCYHPHLWCDGHPVCDNAEDEPITDLTCQQTLLRNGEEYKSGRYLLLFI